jgi:hypothetical protein
VFVVFIVTGEKAKQKEERKLAASKEAFANLDANNDEQLVSNLI